MTANTGGPTANLNLAPARKQRQGFLLDLPENAASSGSNGASHLDRAAYR